MEFLGNFYHGYPEPTVSATREEKKRFHEGKGVGGTKNKKLLKQAMAKLNLYKQTGRLDVKYVWANEAKAAMRKKAPLKNVMHTFERIPKPRRSMRLRKMK